jgi:hypothetical protein
MFVQDREQVRAQHQFVAVVGVGNARRVAGASAPAGLPADRPSGGLRSPHGPGVEVRAAVLADQPA